MTETIADLIRHWQAKAGCMHTQTEAYRRWKPLMFDSRLTEQDIRDLRLGWSHFYLGEGREELDRQCSRIVQRLT